MKNQARDRLFRLLDRSDVSFEAGRAAYYYCFYSIAHLYMMPEKGIRPDVILIAHFQDHRARWYVATMSESTAFSELLHDVLTDPSALSAIEDGITATRDATEARLRACDITTCTNDVLHATVQYYYEQFEYLMRTARRLRYLDRAILPALRFLFRGASDVDDRIALVCSDDRPSFLIEEDDALLSIAQCVGKRICMLDSAEAQSAIADVHGRYAWSSLGYFDEQPQTIDSYRKRIEVMLADDPKRLARARRENNARTRAARDALYTTLDRAGRHLADVATTSVFLKDYFKAAINAIQYAAEPIFVAITQRTGHPLGFVKDCLPREMHDLLCKGHLDDRAVTERVQESVLIAQSPAFFELLAGDDARSFVARYCSLDGTRDNVLTGRCASPGSGQGRARIILQPSDFGIMSDGDVLVVANTGPDYLPVMRKAGAIVAEEGGITAHVSVVSREFGIPCVVGVRGATTLIKTGDMLHVDATNGRITRIHLT